MSSPTPVPPTFADDADLVTLADEPPRWPKVVGIISMCWGSLAILGGLCAVGKGVLDSMNTSAASASAGPMGPPPAVLQPTVPELISQGAGSLWAGVLLAAGIATLMRRSSGRVLHLVYAAVSLVLSLIGFLLLAAKLSAMGQWIQDNPSEKWAGMLKIVRVVMVIMVLVFAVPGLGWLVFCAVWFGPMGKDPSAGAAPDLPTD
jgi:hypothetical protein